MRKTLRAAWPRVTNSATVKVDESARSIGIPSLSKPPTALPTEQACSAESVPTNSVARFGVHDGCGADENASQEIHSAQPGLLDDRWWVGAVGNLGTNRELGVDLPKSSICNLSIWRDSR